MKFLCPNCKAKYRIGPEKMVGRQAAKIRCRKCEYLIQIAYRGNTDEFDVTASPPSVLPPSPAAPTAGRVPKPGAGQPVTTGAMSGAMTGAAASGAGRPRAGALMKDEPSGSKKPTAAVPGLPGLGSPKSTRGAALLSDPSALARRPLAPLPPPPVPPVVGAALGVALAPPATAVPSGSSLGPQGVALPSPPPPRSPSPVPSSTQLGDQFRESVQAGGVPEDLPQEGWFVGVNGVPLGPIPLGDLRELAMAGHIDRRSLVWREGQGEWRPLAKFPGLSRVIDDGASPVATPRPEAPVPSGSGSNGANGHIATGFDVVRADLSERPSAWGDLDDEDEQDEQPTTVKGRVSVLPSADALPPPPPPSVASSAFSGPPSGSANPYGMTSSVVSLPTPLQAPASPLAAPQVSPPSAISATPEAVVEGDMGLRRSGRGRWYLLAIVIALAFAFALGAFATQLMRSSSSEEPASAKPSRRALNDEEKRAASSDTDGEEDAEDEPSAKPLADEPTPLAGGGARPAAPPVANAERTARTIAPRTILGATVSAAPAAAVGSMPGASGPAPKAALLAGLGSSPALGPSLGRADERVSGSGLDATAIQKTVRRHSPGVRQNCWQRALNARAPGVPSSAKVTATITVDGSGHVQAVTVSGAPKGYPGLSRCIEGAVKGWQFPRAGGQTVTNVPFMFVGQ